MHHFGMQSLLTSVRNILQTGSTSVKIAAGERRESSGMHGASSPGQHLHGNDLHANISDLTLSKRPFFGAHQVHPDPLWSDLERGVVNVEDSYHDSADGNDDDNYNDYAIPEGDEDADVESGKYGAVRSFKKEDYSSPSTKVHFQEGVIDDSHFVSEGAAEALSEKYTSVQSFKLEGNAHTNGTTARYQSALKDKSASSGEVNDHGVRDGGEESISPSALPSTSRVDVLYDQLFQQESTTGDAESRDPEGRTMFR